MHRVTVSAKGQVVIPAELRRKLGLSPGAHLRLYESGSKVVLVPELDDPVGAGFGFLKHDHGKNPGLPKEDTRDGV